MSPLSVCEKLFEDFVTLPIEQRCSLIIGHARRILVELFKRHAGFGKYIGTPEANAHAQADAREKMIAFLKRTLEMK